jgi:hypothetical protein
LRKQRRDFYRSCRESNSPLNTELTRDIKSLSDAIKKYEDEKITQILLSNFAKKYFHYEPGTFVKSDKFFQQELFTLLEKEKSWFLEYGLPTKSISVPLNPTEEKNKGTAIVLGGSSDLNSQIKLSGTETIICCYEKKLVALDMASESAFWFYFDD